MQNTNESTNPYFIYFVSHANIVLGCTKETIKLIYRNHKVCDLEYSQKEGVNEKSIEIQVDRIYLFCDFDELGICEASHVFFDNMNDVDKYIALFNQLFKYDAMTKSWQSLSYFVMCIEDDEE